MARVFAYCRVSTAEQTVENQVRELEAAGFQVAPHRIAQDVISGSVAAMQRPGFAKLMDKLEPGDVLVVTKLDRLGRSALDVRQTVDLLAGKGVRVHCLALGGMDLTSAAGRMTMGVISCVAEFERDLLIERTQSGQARARAQGKKFGRPMAMDDAQQLEALQMLKEGGTVAAVARRLRVSRRTIDRLVVRAAAASPL